MCYQVQPSPLGRLLIAVSSDGLCLVDMGAGAGALDRLQETGDVAHGGASVEAASREIDAFLSGRRQRFSIPVDLSFASSFARRVLTRLQTVEFGDLTSYGELARMESTSPRAVGRAVGSNPVPIVVPCHRVIAADGSLGGYGCGLDRKRKLLAIEGHAELPGGWEPHRRTAAPPHRVSGRRRGRYKMPGE